MKNIVKDITDYELTPFYYILSSITDLFTAFLQVIQSIRGIIYFIREQFKLFTLFIFLKFVNVNIVLNNSFTYLEQLDPPLPAALRYSF